MGREIPAAKILAGSGKGRGQRREPVLFQREPFCRILGARRKTAVFGGYAQRETEKGGTDVLSVFLGPPSGRGREDHTVLPEPVVEIGVPDRYRRILLYGAVHDGGKGAAVRR